MIEIGIVVAFTAFMGAITYGAIILTKDKLKVN